MKTSTPKKALSLQFPLIALFGATTISMLGSVLTLIAVPWFVLVTTKSATKVGLTAFCETVSIMLAGILIALLGTSRLLWIDAATFLISAVIIALALPRSSVVPAKEPNRRYVTELKEGLQFILHDRLLFAIIVTVMITNFLDAPFLSVIMPVYMRNRFSNAVDFGL